MAKCNVSEIQKSIKVGLLELECSNIKSVDKKKYLEFKERYEKLDELVATKKSPSELSSIEQKVKKIEEDFNIYMENDEGMEKIASFQTSSLKKVLSNLANKLTVNNVEETEKELEETLSYTKSMSTNELSSASIINTINKTKYEIYKYKLNDSIWDDLAKVEEFLPCILEDIYNLMKNPDAPIEITEKLEKYLITPGLIKKNYNKPIILINLANNQEHDEDVIRDELNKSFYQASDLKKDATKFTDKMKDYIKTLQSSKKSVESLVEKIYREHNNKTLPDYLAAYFVKLNEKQKDQKALIRELIKKDYKNYISLFKAIIVNYPQTCMCYLLDLKKMFDSENLNVDYQIDCAILAYLKDIKIGNSDGLTYNGQFLKDYILLSNSDYFLNYFLKNNFVDREMMEYEIEHHAHAFLQKIKKCKDCATLKAYVECLMDLGCSIEPVLNHFLKNMKMDEEQLKDWLIATSIRLIDTPDFACVFAKIEELNNPRLIIKLMEKVYSKSQKYRLDKILKQIEQNKLKEEVMTIIYQEIDRIDEQLIDQSVKETFALYAYANGAHKEDILSRKANIFEAYMFSKKVSINQKEVIEGLIKNYADVKLDWQNIVSTLKKTWNNNLKNETYFKLYENNKDEFWRLNEEYNLLTLDLIEKIVKSNPVELSQFINFLNYSEIFQFDNHILDIYCENFEHKLKEEKKTLSDVILATFNSKSEKGELLTYIAHKGLISNELLIYYDEEYKDFYLKSIINSKDTYKLAYYYKKILDKKTKRKIRLKDLIAKPINYDFLFLTTLELEEIKNDAEGKDMGDIKLRKYYWDLINLMDDIDEDTRRRIVAYVAKSNYEELINWLKTNYPEYSNLLYESVSNELKVKIFKDHYIY